MLTERGAALTTGNKAGTSTDVEYSNVITGKIKKWSFHYNKIKIHTRTYFLLENFIFQSFYITPYTLKKNFIHTKKVKLKHTIFLDLGKLIKLHCCVIKIFV